MELIRILLNLDKRKIIVQIQEIIVQIRLIYSSDENTEKKFSVVRKISLCGNPPLYRQPLSWISTGTKYFAVKHFRSISLQLRVIMQS